MSSEFVFAKENHAALFKHIKQRIRPAYESVFGRQLE